jgi:hypothetical protein
MTLKKLTWRLILPLTIISFSTITKWWYVLPVDAPDTMMIGFPFAFVADGWFTSMSIQIFVIEFVTDFIIYFLFWLLIVLLIKRYLSQISIHKYLIRLIWSMAILLVVFWFAVFNASEKMIKAHREWNMQVLVTGYKFTWTYTDRSGFSRYDPNKK